MKNGQIKFYLSIFRYVVYCNNFSIFSKYLLTHECLKAIWILCHLVICLLFFSFGAFKFRNLNCHLSSFAWYVLSDGFFIAFELRNGATVICLLISWNCSLTFFSYYLPHKFPKYFIFLLWNWAAIVLILTDFIFLVSLRF